MCCISCDLALCEMKTPRSLYNLHPHPSEVEKHAFMPKNQQKFCMSYKNKEAPIYLPTEEYPIENLGITTRPEIHKYALKHLYKTHKQSQLEIA